MQKVKAFLNGALKVLGKTLTAVLFIFTLAIISAWTVGLFYAANSTSCVMNEGSIVCEFKQ